MWLVAGLGAIAAGLLLLLRELIPWMEANRTGKVRTRGARSQTVSRTADSERFRALVDRRLKAAGPGALFVVGGLGWLGWNFLGLVLSQ